MADQDVAAMEAKERREAAQKDAMILAEAEVIRQSEKRYSLAREVAGEMAFKSMQRGDAFTKIAEGVLNYPSLEQADTGEAGVS